uniref:Uncharacterized protein n=1 Tax=Tanacetum cinerariifolium TaxID=118510 RepID=A0A699GG40_TANCI|nr:hypothetical protein [Tanacetum cinerariifolium]
MAWRQRDHARTGAAGCQRRRVARIVRLIDERAEVHLKMLLQVAQHVVCAYLVALVGRIRYPVRQEQHMGQVAHGIIRAGEFGQYGTRGAPGQRRAAPGAGRRCSWPAPVAYAQPLGNHGANAVGRAAVPVLRDAAGLAAVAQDVAAQRQDHRRIAPRDGVAALGDGDRPLGIFAQCQARNAQRRGFFLHAAGIGQHHARVLHHAQHVQVGLRLHAGEAGGFQQRRQLVLADHGARARVQRKQDRQFRTEPDDGFQQAAQALGIVHIGRPVQREQRIRRAVRHEAGQVGGAQHLRHGGRGRQLAQQRIDHHVAHEMDAAGRNALAQQVAGAAGLAGKQQLGHLVGEHAVDFLRHRTVVAAQAGLDVKYGDLLLGRRQRAGQRGIDVAHYQHCRRPRLLQHRLEAAHHFGSLHRVPPAGRESRARTTRAGSAPSSSGWAGRPPHTRYAGELRVTWSDSVSKGRRHGGANAVLAVVAAGVAGVAAVAQVDVGAEARTQLVGKRGRQHAVAVLAPRGQRLRAAVAGAHRDPGAGRQAPVPAGLGGALARAVFQRQLVRPGQDAVDRARCLRRAVGARQVERQRAARAAVHAGHAQRLLQVIAVAEKVDVAVRAQHLRDQQEHLDALQALLRVRYLGFPQLVQEIAEPAGCNAEELGMHGGDVFVISDGPGHAAHAVGRIERIGPAEVPPAEAGRHPGARRRRPVAAGRPVLALGLAAGGVVILLFVAAGGERAQRAVDGIAERERRVAHGHRRQRAVVDVAAVEHQVPVPAAAAVVAQQAQVGGVARDLQQAAAVHALHVVAQSGGGQAAEIMLKIRAEAVGADGLAVGGILGRIELARPESRDVLQADVGPRSQVQPAWQHLGMGAGVELMVAAAAPALVCHGVPRVRQRQLQARAVVDVQRDAGRKLSAQFALRLRRGRQVDVVGVTFAHAHGGDDGPVDGRGSRGPGGQQRQRQQRQHRCPADIGTMLDPLQRFLDRVLRGAFGFHHHHDLPHLRGQHAGLGGQQQRRRVEDDDAVGIAFGNVGQQAAHAAAGQQLGRMLVGAAGRQDAERADIGSEHDVGQPGLLAQQDVHQPRSRRQAQHLEYGRAGHVGIDQHYRAVPFHGDAHRQVDGTISLAFAGQGAGDHDEVAVANAAAVGAVARVAGIPARIAQQRALDDAKILGHRGAAAVLGHHAQLGEPGQHATVGKEQAGQAGAEHDLAAAAAPAFALSPAHRHRAQHGQAGACAQFGRAEEGGAHLADQQGCRHARQQGPAQHQRGQQEPVGAVGRERHRGRVDDLEGHHVGGGAEVARQLGRLAPADQLFVVFLVDQVIAVQLRQLRLHLGHGIGLVQQALVARGVFLHPGANGSHARLGLGVRDLELLQHRAVILARVDGCLQLAFLELARLELRHQPLGGHDIGVQLGVLQAQCIEAFIERGNAAVQFGIGDGGRPQVGRQDRFVARDLPGNGMARPFGLQQLEPGGVELVGRLQQLAAEIGALARQQARVLALEAAFDKNRQQRLHHVAHQARVGIAVGDRVNIVVGGAADADLAHQFVKLALLFAGGAGIDVEIDHAHHAFHVGAAEQGPAHDRHLLFDVGDAGHAGQQRFEDALGVDEYARRGLVIVGQQRHLGPAQHGHQPHHRHGGPAVFPDPLETGDELADQLLHTQILQGRPTGN